MKHYIIMMLMLYILQLCKKKLMPVGKPIAFEGNISKVESDAFGFFYCDITSPKYLEHPIIQRSIKTSEGLRTVGVIGKVGY